jgi:hypothetical protein
MLFDPECSQAIQKAQNLLKKCNFQKILETSLS